MFKRNVGIIGNFLKDFIHQKLKSLKKQEAQLTLTNPRDAFRDHPSSLYTVQFDMLGMVPISVL